jgi:hypothetical protein
MTLETAALIATIVGGGAAAASSIVPLLTKPDKQPQAQPLSGTFDQKEQETAQRSAEDKARRQALAASQQQSTILTSPTGISSGTRSILGG